MNIDLVCVDRCWMLIRGRGRLTTNRSLRGQLVNGKHTTYQQDGKHKRRNHAETTESRVSWGCVSEKSQFQMIALRCWWLYHIIQWQLILAHSFPLGRSEGGPMLCEAVPDTFNRPAVIFHRGIMALERLNNLYVERVKTLYCALSCQRRSDLFVYLVWNEMFALMLSHVDPPLAYCL